MSKIACLSRRSFWRKGRLVLEWLPGFLPKSARPDWRPKPPSILKVTGDSRRLLAICPVRAYLELSKRRDLKVNPRDNQFLWMIKQQALDKAFRAVIRDSLLFAGKNENVVSYPHMSKKLAVSYSILYFPRKKAELPALTGNINMNVVKRVYANSVPPLSRPVVVPLGTVNPVALD